MKNDRELACYQKLKFYYDNNLIMCETCRRTWKEHDSGGSCGAEAYYDRSFLPINRNLYHDAHSNLPHLNVEWARISSFSINAIFNTLSWSTIMDSAQPGDALQGYGEDCWLIAAMAVLPRNKSVLKNLFPIYQNYPRGIYNVQLYLFGTWRNVLVDDFVPCYENFYPLHANAYRMWAALVEKAVAKFYGCYEALDGGSLVESLNLLTGAPSSYISLTDELGLRFTPDTLWQRLNYSIEKNYFILAASAGSRKKTDAAAEFVNIGLQEMHAYCVLSITKVCGRRLIKLLNPKSTIEYKGKWSYDTLNDQPDLQKLLYENCQEREFWMDYSIFQEYFEEICISKIRDDYNIFSVKKTLHPLSVRNPSGIYFTIQKRRVVDFVLHQMSRRTLPRQTRRNMDLFLIIFKRNRAGNYVYFAHSRRDLTNVLTLNLKLYRGYYFIVPITFANFGTIFIQTVYSRCLLEVFTPDRLFMDKHWYPFDRLREILVNIAKVNGKTNRYQSAVVYEYSHDFVGVAVVIENEDRHRSLFVKSTYIGELDKYESTRGAMTTQDVIPPRHTQIVAVLTLIVGGHAVNSVCFRYQFDVLGEENEPRMPVHDPFIDYRTDPLHPPYLDNKYNQ